MGVGRYKPTISGATAAIAWGMILAQSHPVVAGPPVAQPTPYQRPLYWDGLPSPTALVHLKTALGEFVLPMGYLRNWFSLKEQPVTTAPDGGRMFSGILSFQFEFPSGGMNGNTPWMVVVHDAQGRAVEGHTVVYVNKTAPPDSWSEGLEDETLGAHPLGSLVRVESRSRPNHEVLVGAAAGSDPGHGIGVELSCEVNCLFRFYLERQRLVMEGFMEGRFRQDGLKIAEQAQVLIEHWR